ncbi:hypothetical protein A7R67_01985 [Escherichia coli]|nr:hypothetical protein A7R67_01985 [Escherichia coli]
MKYQCLARVSVEHYLLSAQCWYRKNSIILIDEIENGIHYSVIKDIIKIINFICKKQKTTIKYLQQLIVKM